MLNIKQMLQGSADLELHNGTSCSTEFLTICTYRDRHRCIGVTVFISGQISTETACKIPLIKVHILDRDRHGKQVKQDHSGAISRTRYYQHIKSVWEDSWFPPVVFILTFQVGHSF